MLVVMGAGVGRRRSRDDRGRYARETSGRTPPTGPAGSGASGGGDRGRAILSAAGGSDSDRNVQAERLGYGDMWERSRRNRRAHAFEYAARTFDDGDIVWGTVWAVDEESAARQVREKYRARGYREGEFSVSDLSPSPDGGFADAQEVYARVLGSPSGRWLLKENPHPDPEYGGWVAVNAVHERLTITRVGGVWRLSEWDPGNGLTAPSTMHLGDFASAEECVAAADSRIQ